MQKTTILVCVHKQDKCLTEAPYQPIHVGKALTDKELGFAGDDTGDNISTQNRNYCELTAQYWAWKNPDDAAYVGLNHYRRYFAFDRAAIANVITETSDSFFGRSHPTSDFERLFRRYDIILPVERVYPYNLYTNYRKCHSEQDMDTLREVVLERSPEYLDAFDKLIFRNNRLAPFNMFVMPRERFNDYSAWLFDILAHTRQRITISDDPMQARVLGYMSERLLNVYVLRHQLRVCRRSVVMVEDKVHKSVFKYLFHTAVNSLMFYIGYPLGLNRTPESRR